MTPQFAAMAFYGAIEQVLTGWIFDVLPRGDAEYEQAKDYVVETICGGPGPRSSGDRLSRLPRMDNDVVKRLIWAGLLAGLGALASIATHEAGRGHLAPRLRGGPAGMTDERHSPTTAGPTPQPTPTVTVTRSTPTHPPGTAADENALPFGIPPRPARRSSSAPPFAGGLVAAIILKRLGAD